MKWNVLFRSSLCTLHRVMRPDSTRKKWNEGWNTLEIWISDLLVSVLWNLHKKSLFMRIYRDIKVYPVHKHAVINVNYITVKWFSITSEINNQWFTCKHKIYTRSLCVLYCHRRSEIQKHNDLVQISCLFACIWYKSGCIRNCRIITHSCSNFFVLTFVTQEEPPWS